MNKKIPLAAAVLLCLACLVLGGGLAFLWLGGGTPPPGAPAAGQHPGAEYPGPHALPGTGSHTLPHPGGGA